MPMVWIGNSGSRKRKRGMNPLSDGIGRTAPTGVRVLGWRRSAHSALLRLQERIHALVLRTMQTGDGGRGWMRRRQDKEKEMCRTMRRWGRTTVLQWMCLICLAHAGAAWNMPAEPASSQSVAWALASP